MPIIDESNAYYLPNTLSLSAIRLWNKMYRMWLLNSVCIGANTLSVFRGLTQKIHLRLYQNLLLVFMFKLVQCIIIHEYHVKKHMNVLSYGVYTINSLSNDNLLSKHYKKDSQRVCYPLAYSKFTFIVIIVKRIYIFLQNCFINISFLLWKSAIL